MIPNQTPDEFHQIDSPADDTNSNSAAADSCMDDLLAAPLPLVLTGKTASDLRSFMANSLISKLEVDLTVTRATMFSPHYEDDGLLHSLAEALCASYSGLTHELLDSVSPNNWGTVIREIIQHSKSPQMRRLFIVDQFEDVFLATQGERETFTRVLTHLARESETTVILGATEGSVRRCRKLPGLRQALREGARLSIDNPNWSAPKLSKSSRIANRIRRFNDRLHAQIFEFSNAISDMAVGRGLAIGGAASLVAAAGITTWALWPDGKLTAPSSTTAASEPGQVETAVEAPSPSVDSAANLVSARPETTEPEPAAAVTEVDEPVRETPPVTLVEGTVEIQMEEADAVLPPKNLTPVSADAANRALKHKPKPKQHEDGSPAGEVETETSESPADVSSGRGNAPEKDKNPNQP